MDWRQCKQIDYGGGISSILPVCTMCMGFYERKSSKSVLDDDAE